MAASWNGWIAPQKKNSISLEKLEKRPWDKRHHLTSYDNGADSCGQQRYVMKREYFMHTGVLRDRPRRRVPRSTSWCSFREVDEQQPPSFLPHVLVSWPRTYAVGSNLLKQSPSSPSLPSSRQSTAAKSTRAAGQLMSLDGMMTAQDEEAKVRQATAQPTVPSAIEDKAEQPRAFVLEMSGRMTADEEASHSDSKQSDVGAVQHR
eukprot:TRINITY_DN6656_c0_g1_i2.p1 TRINITY_DN6656_c0_g1~~TRINITY_DN6656_c0_g1_i2.p1  ORF type:complete len:225 (+),score=34.74 TRINITY_DN6656_c0_g1_i2:63-677(+)